jgi:hypothetical protein
MEELKLGTTINGGWRQEAGKDGRIYWFGQHADGLFVLIGRDSEGFVSVDMRPIHTPKGGDRYILRHHLGNLGKLLGDIPEPGDIPVGPVGEPPARETPAELLNGTRLADIETQYAELTRQIEALGGDGAKAAEELWLQRAELLTCAASALFGTEESAFVAWMKAAIKLDQDEAEGMLDMSQKPLCWKQRSRASGAAAS